MDADSAHFAHAFEDLPAEARLQAAEIASTQPGISLRRRIREELETFGLDSYGTLEECRLLRFLSRYPVTAYTYPVSRRVWRGARPDAAKLAELAGGDQVRATINLCAEMPEGDAPAIAAAGLAGRLRTTHLPITDMEAPTVAQLTELMDLLSGPDGELTYLHCEAGRGRTGVMIACYRMAVTGCRSAPSARRRPSCRRPSTPRRTPRKRTIHCRAAGRGRNRNRSEVTDMRTRVRR